MAKKIAAIILGVLDAVLLIVIIISVSTGWRIRRDAPVQSEEDQSDTASLPFLSDSSAPPVVSDEPPKQESSAPPVVSDEPSQQESSAPPVVSDEPSKQESTVPPVVSDEPSQQESSAPPVVSDEPSTQESTVPPVVSDEPSKQESSVPPVVSDEPSKQESSVPPVVSDEPSVREIPDANSISTSEYPVVGDIVSFDIHHGWTGFSPDSVYIPEAYQVIGGWKAYFVIDPDQKMGQAIEKFANVNISFAQSGMTVTVDWYRTFNGDLTKGTPDNAPDSSFSGEWSSGMIDAVGSGRIILGEFCYDHGREYAAGRMIWPDGTESVIGLIRP